MAVSVSATAIEPLLRIAREDPDPIMRAEALDAAASFPLARDGWQAVAAMLHTALIESQGSEARRTAIGVAVRCPLTSMRRFVRAIAEDVADPDAAAARGALAAVRDESQLSLLLDEARAGTAAAFEPLAAMPLEDAGLTPVTINLPHPALDPDAQLWRALAYARVGDFEAIDAFLTGKFDTPPMFWGGPWAPYDRLAVARPVPPPMREHLLELFRSQPPDTSGDLARTTRIIVGALTGTMDAEGTPLPPPVPHPGTTARFRRSRAKPPSPVDEDDEKWKPATLHDVLDRVQARSAWQYGRGAGVTIAIVDSGIRSTVDFPLNKRVRDSICLGFDGKAWNDTHGHGSMVASIAAATTSAGGKFNGVAPEAKILACPTPYQSATIFIALDRIIAKLKSGSFAPPFVLNYSLGTAGTSPPSFGRDSAHVVALEELIALGTFVSCAAGNNHDCKQPGFEPEADGPNTIWGPNSLDAVCSVGAVNARDSNTSGMHTHSSRGPGQWATATTKPDCVAPSYGEVLWGNAYRALKWWGTSGAAPQRRARQLFARR